MPSQDQPRPPKRATPAPAGVVSAPAERHAVPARADPATTGPGCRADRTLRSKPAGCDWPGGCAPGRTDDGGLVSLPTRTGLMVLGAPIHHPGSCLRGGGGAIPILDSGRYSRPPLGPTLTIPAT